MLFLSTSLGTGKNTQLPEPVMRGVVWVVAASVLKNFIAALTSADKAHTTGSKTLVKSSVNSLVKA